MTAALSFALAHWRLILSGLAFAALGFMLVSARSDAKHWHEQADRYEALYHSEQLALKATEANYRAAAKQAEAEDAANKARVERDQTQISQEVSHDYQTRLAALHARYDALRVRGSGAPAADPGGSGTADMPEASGPAGRFDGAGPLDPFACEANTLQLSALQQWIKQQSAVPFSADNSITPPG